MVAIVFLPEIKKFQYCEIKYISCVISCQLTIWAYNLHETKYTHLKYTVKWILSNVYTAITMTIIMIQNGFYKPKMFSYTFFTPLKLLTLPQIQVTINVPFFTLKQLCLFWTYTHLEHRILPFCTVLIVRLLVTLLSKMVARSPEILFAKDQKMG